MDKLFKNKKLIIILTAIIVILIIGAIFIYIAITKDLFNNTKTSISQSEVSQVENIKEADKENEIIDNNPEEVSNNIQEQIENTENNNIQNNQPEADTTTKVIEQNNQSMTQTKETKAVNQNTKAVETKTTTKSTKAQEETPKTMQSNSQTQTPVTQQTTPKQEEPKQIQCSGNNHLIGTGNTGRWFNTRQEAINYYNSTYANWSKKWENFEIDDDTFNKNCPNRYEIYQCICGKWTIDFFYEYLNKIYFLRASN